MDRAEAIEGARRTALELAELSRERARLSDALADALAVQAWQHDAFAGGPCRIAVMGTAHARKPEEMRLELHLAGGETRTFKLSDVPRDVWPAAMRKRFP